MTVVSDLMTSTVVTVSPITSMGRVLEILESHAISAVPVVDEGRLIGIVSTTDLVPVVAMHMNNDHELFVKDVMHSPVLTTTPSSPIEEAGRRMAAGRVHRLVVVDDRERVVGILSARDVLEEAKRLRVAAPISSFMTKPVVTVDIGDSIDLAMERIAQARVHGLVVMDGSRAVGVFTQAEALAARTLPQKLRENPVEEMMSYETIFLESSTPLYRAAGYATAMNVRRILVVEHRDLVGVLSSIDLVDAISRAS
jgi:CBS domain-containing protein